MYSFLLLVGVWRGWQSVHRGEVGKLGLVVRLWVSDLLGVSWGVGDECMKLS